MHSEKDCIFCKIVSGQIGATKIYEDQDFCCVRDIQPQARTHLLVIPKEHVASLDAAFPVNEPGKVDLVGRMLQVAVKVARENKLLPGGFRTVINTNKDSGQTVFHLHAHILGGDTLANSFG